MMPFERLVEELVPERAGRSKVDDIIKEEMNHIKMLAGKLMEFK